MRWTYAVALTERERAQRAKVQQRIDAWWAAFQLKKDKISDLFSQKTKWDLPDWMEKNLGAIDPNIMWEYGPAVQPGITHRLVLTPESRHYLRPLVATILDRAPAIPGWEFYPHRLSEEFEEAQSTVEGRCDESIADWSVRVEPGKHNRIDLTFLVPKKKTSHQEMNAAFIAVESLLGEAILDCWVGAIEVEPARKSSDGVPIEELKVSTEQAINKIRKIIVSEPHYEWPEDTEWSLFKLEPDRDEDEYPEQTDLYVGRSMNADLWTAAHSGQLFFSERFSNCGETFCYLIIDGSEGFDDWTFKDKSEIEDAIDELLKPKKLGCHIGGGTGLRYSYIDLALTDTRPGIVALRQLLQKAKLPKRSWIQFFDSDLAAEWVGIYDDTLEPPMRDFEE